MKHLLFVYGKLRRGGGLPMSINFPNSKFIANAKVPGRLYDLGPYPGLLLGESNSTAVGEVHEVDDEILNKLDEIEGSSEYWRKQIEVSVGAERRMCWIYLPDHDAEFYADRTLIASGDWIEYSQTKTIDANL